MIGKVLFGIGSIMAITAGAKVPEASAQWSTVLPYFFGGIMLAVGGNVLWHKDEKKNVQEMLEKHRDSEDNPINVLGRTVTEIERLQKNFSSLTNQSVCDEIDRISEEFIHVFTDKRKTVMDILGMEKGAEVLLTVAYGERLLNRVWSACSDHHRPEAEKSLARSVENYQKAKSLAH